MEAVRRGWIQAGYIGKAEILRSERKGKGSEDNFGFRDSLAYPFLNTGTLYSEIQPSSGTLARGPPNPSASSLSPCPKRGRTPCSTSYLPHTTSGLEEVGRDD